MVGVLADKGPGEKKSINSYFDNGLFPFIRKRPNFGFSNSKFASRVFAGSTAKLKIFNDNDVTNVASLREKGIILKKDMTR